MIILLCCLAWWIIGMVLFANLCLRIDGYLKYRDLGICVFCGILGPFVALYYFMLDDWGNKILFERKRK